LILLKFLVNTFVIGSNAGENWQATVLDLAGLKLRRAKNFQKRRRNS